MAAISFEHADDARNALHAIVSDPVHGKDALSSPQIVSNLLQDLLPDAPRESSLLMAAANAGLPAALREHVALGMDVETAIGLVAATLAAKTAFSRSACLWVATELAVALGLASPDVKAILPPEDEDEADAGPADGSAGPGQTQVAQASPVQASPVPVSPAQADAVQASPAQADAVQAGAAPTAQVTSDAWRRALGTDPAASPATGFDRAGPTTPIAAPPPVQLRDRRIIAAAVLVGCIVIAGAVIGGTLFLSSGAHNSSPSAGASVPSQGVPGSGGSVTPSQGGSTPPRSTTPSSVGGGTGYHRTSTLSPGTPNSSMTQVAWTPDSSMVATSDKDGTTYLWNPTTGNLISRFATPGCSQALATAMSPDGSTLAVGCLNGSTYLWNIASGNLLGTLSDPALGTATPEVNSVAFSPNGRRLVSADNNGYAFVWRVGSANLSSTPVKSLADPARSGLWSAAFSSDGTLATGDYAGAIYLWDIGSGSRVGSFSVPDGLNVTALAFSPDGSVLAAGTGTGTGTGTQGGLYLLSTSSGQVSQDMITNPGAVWALSFHGSTLAAADDDGQTYLFTVHEGSTSAISGQTLADPNPGSQGVGAMAFSPNGKLLVTGDTSGNGQAYVWSSG